jgi:hypothetical protein
MDLDDRRNLRTLAYVHSWFKEACGSGTPIQAHHFAQCSERLAGSISLTLQGALDACDLLDDATDGARLVADLKARVDLDWPAHLFDAILHKCVERLGNPGLDLRSVRRRYLERWRKVLAEADEEQRERVLVIGIETSLMREIEDRLPMTAQEIACKLALSSPSMIIAALILLSDAQKYGNLAPASLIEEVARQTDTLAPVQDEQPRLAGQVVEGAGFEPA